MKTAAYAVKKGHSGNSGHTSSGDKSSKHEKDIGGSSRSSDSKGASDNMIGKEGDKTATNKKDNNQGTNGNTNTNNNQPLTPSATLGEQQNLQSQQLPPDQSQLTTPTTPPQEQEQQQSSLFLLSNRLRNKPFWIWDIQEHRREDILTKGDCSLEPHYRFTYKEWR